MRELSPLLQKEKKTALVNSDDLNTAANEDLPDQKRASIKSSGGAISANDTAVQKETKNDKTLTAQLSKQLTRKLSNTAKTAKGRMSLMSQSNLGAAFEKQIDPEVDFNGTQITILNNVITNQNARIAVWPLMHL